MEKIEVMINRIKFIADDRGITLKHKKTELLLEAVSDQWGEYEAAEFLTSLINLYSYGMSQKEIVNHFKRMIEEGI